MTQRWTENGKDFIDTKNGYDVEVSEAYCEDIPILLAYIADLGAVVDAAREAKHMIILLLNYAMFLPNWMINSKTVRKIKRRQATSDWRRGLPKVGLFTV